MATIVSNSLHEQNYQPDVFHSKKGIICLNNREPAPVLKKKALNCDIKGLCPIFAIPEKYKHREYKRLWTN